MFPILLVSQSLQNVDNFIQNIIKEGKYSQTAIYRYKSQGTIITIEQIREITSLFKRVPEKLLICIYNFDSAKKESQNAFLKTLEEKNHYAQFVLQVFSEESVLPTIQSRCIVKRIYEKSDKTTRLDFPAISLSELNDMTKEKAIEFCDSIIAYAHTAIHAHIPIIPSYIKEVLRVRNLLIKNNINPQLTVDHLFLNFKLQNSNSSKAPNI